MNYLVALLMVRGGEAFVTGAPRAVSVRRHLGVDEGLDIGVAPLVLAFAGVLAAAGKLQADAMSGDQGLAAFLRDGDGYNKSGYKPQKPNRDADAATADAAEVVERRENPIHALIRSFFKVLGSPFALIQKLFGGKKP